MESLWKIQKGTITLNIAATEVSIETCVETPEEGVRSKKGEVVVVEEEWETEEEESYDK